MTTDNNTQCCKHTCILSQYEYCSPVWHFCSRDKMKKIESIQQQVYVFNDFNASHSELLEKANGPLIYTHRFRHTLSQMIICRKMY